MKDTVLRLHDKTVVIAGPLSSMTQGLITFFTEQGADVGLIGRVAQAQKFADNVNDAREVNAEFGRAMTYEADLSKPEAAREAIGRVAETFGSIDALVDAHTFDRDSQLTMTSTMTQQALTFLEGKQKSRIIYLCYEAIALTGLSGAADLKALEDVRQKLIAFTRTKANEFTDRGLTVNCVSVGVNEEFLLRAFPKAPSIRGALDMLRQKYPKARIVDPMDVAAVVAFLTSPLSQAITGQVLAVNHGFES